MLPLDCLLCDWLVGRAWRSSWANDDRYLDTDVVRLYQTGKLRVYTYENSCLIFGPDTTTTNPCNSSAAPDNFDIVFTKGLPSPLHLTSCSALSSDRLPLIINTIYRSSFYTYLIALTSDTLHGPNSRPVWKTKFLSTLIYTTRWQSTRELGTCSAPL